MSELTTPIPGDFTFLGKCRCVVNRKQFGSILSCYQDKYLGSNTRTSAKILPSINYLIKHLASFEPPTGTFYPRPIQDGLPTCKCSLVDYNLMSPTVWFEDVFKKSPSEQGAAEELNACHHRICGSQGQLPCPGRYILKCFTCFVDTLSSRKIVWFWW